MSFILKRLLKYFLYFISGYAILEAVLAVYLIWFQPAFYFPKPTGAYAVGVKMYHWIDANRKETLSVDADSTHPERELMVNVWFPSQGILSDKPTTPYAPDFVDYVKKHDKLFARQIYVYAESEALLAADTSYLPVIIVSHGSGSFRDDYIAYCEELASNGYVVVGMSHTYDSTIVKFPDGRIVDGAGSMGNRYANKNWVELQAQLDKELEIRIADAKFVLDKLEHLNSDEKSIFYQRLDQNNIGMFGHSFGGTTAIQVCYRDHRIKAVVGLDADLFGPDVTKKFDKPCMFMLSEYQVKENERAWTIDDWKKNKINSQEEANKFKSSYLPAFEKLTKSNESDVYTFVLKGTEHMAFCDYAIFKHIPSRIFVKLGLAGDMRVGSIDGFRATEIINAYLVSFFDKYLKGKSSQLLDGKSKKYPEVETKVWK